MSPNSKLTASLNRSLHKIAADQFDEYDIKMLLIDVREYLREETFLREVADFVAHPQRERGICHKAINARYAKMKMASEGTKKLIESNIMTREPNKPDNFYTDKILSYISLPTISKDDYQLFVLDSLDDLTDEILIKYYNINKHDAHQLLKKAFTKNVGFYHLNTKLTLNSIRFIDDLLKFIRGTVLGIGALSYDKLQYQFNTALGRVAKDLRLAAFQSKAFSRKFDAIFVSILALMHDAKFKLYDGQEATAYLSLHGNRTTPHESACSSYSIALMAQTPSFSFPIVTSDIGYAEFIGEEGINPADFDLKPIPWVHTVREGNRLLLKKSAGT